MTMFKTNKDLQEEIKMFKQYTSMKLRNLESLLSKLIDFSRDDLKRLDKMQEIAETTGNLEEGK